MMYHNFNSSIRGNQGDGSAVDLEENRPSIT